MNKNSINTPLGLKLIFLYIAPLCIYLQSLVFIKDNIPATIYITTIIILCIFTCRWNFRFSINRLILILFILILMTASFLNQGWLFFLQNIVLILLLHVVVNLKDISISFKFIRYVGMACAVFCLFQIAFPHNYEILISNFFNEQNFNVVMRLYSWDGSASGLMPQTSHAAGYILTAFLVSSFANTKKKSKYYYLENAVYVIALLFTHKRAHFVFGLFAWLVTVVISDKRPKKLQRLLLTAICIISLTVVAFVLLPYLNPGGTVARLVFTFQNLNNADVDISSGRVFLAHEAIELIKSSFMFGHGFGSFKKLSSFGTDVHNVYLQVFAEMGIFVFLFFVCLITTSVNKTVKLILKLKKTDNNELIYFLKVSLAYQLFFIMYSFTGNTLYNIDFWSMYIFMTLVFFVCRSQADEQSLSHNN